MLIKQYKCSSLHSSNADKTSLLLSPLGEPNKSLKMKHKTLPTFSSFLFVLLHETMIAQ